MSPAAIAQHEAAHAVVCVRLGLPLKSTDVRRRPVSDEDRKGRGVPDDVDVVSGGFTTLVPGTAEAWDVEARQGDPAAQANLESLAIMTAAGIIAAGQYEAPACRDDAYELIKIGRVLGVGNSEQDAAMEGWVNKTLDRAKELLYQDGGVAWDRVRVVLQRKQKLSGAEVERLVAESDSRLT